MNFKINDLPLRYMRFDKMSVFKKLITERDYKFLTDRLKDTTESWDCYLKHNSVNEYFIGVLNKEGIDFIYNSSVHREALNEWELDFIDLSYECELPFLLGYIILEKDMELNKYNRHNRYIKLITTNIERIGVATMMIDKYERKLKRDLFPLCIIKSSFNFWSNWFSKKYGLERLHQFEKFIHYKGHNLSDEVNYYKFFNFIEITQENCQMRLEDVKL